MFLVKREEKKKTKYMKYLKGLQRKIQWTKISLNEKKRIILKSMLFKANIMCYGLTSPMFLK